MKSFGVLVLLFLGFQQNIDIAAKELSAESYQDIFKKAVKAID